MIKVHSKALNQSTEIDRIIGRLNGGKEGPTVIFMAGIHGNEPAGIFSLKRVLTEIQHKNFKGTIYGIAGNLRALEKGIRYTNEDLNRVWTMDRMQKLPTSITDIENDDIAEQVEINHIIQSILENETGPFYFFDIHTTSGQTPPFLTVNDCLLNRAYTKQYPLPIILGIEEYLDGPILSYINELGYVAFGFEAGQHDEINSVENGIAFIYLSLVFTGCLNKKHIDFNRFHNQLADSGKEHQHIYEIASRYLIENGEAFKMMPGYKNFQKIAKSQKLAISNGTTIKSIQNGRIFMPLYQSQGSDGFFMIKKIWKPFLTLSAIIRKIRLDHFLVLLPGIKWIDQKKSGLLVDRFIAKFLAKDIFHLFGYRSVQVDSQYLKMYNREANARFLMYRNEKWF